MSCPKLSYWPASSARTLAGKCIQRAVANQSPHKFAWYTGDPANYNSLLAGKVIRGAAAFGNHVEIHADEMLLTISTPIKYHAPGEKLPPKHQLLLELDGGAAVTCTVQMWGAMCCFPKGTQGALPDYQVAKQRPSPLETAFDEAYFDSLIPAEPGSLSAKMFLATEQRIPGLGNGVLQDILWTAQIHPRRKLVDIGLGEMNEMFTAVKTVLRQMTDQGGRDTERDLFDRPGGYRTILSKNTAGQPCPTAARQ